MKIISNKIILVSRTGHKLEKIASRKMFSFPPFLRLKNVTSEARMGILTLYINLPVHTEEKNLKKKIGECEHRATAERY